MRSCSTRLNASLSRPAPAPRVSMTAPVPPHGADARGPSMIAVVSYLPTRERLLERACSEWCRSLATAPIWNGSPSTPPPTHLMSVTAVAPALRSVRLGRCRSTATTRGTTNGTSSRRSRRVRYSAQSQSASHDTRVSAYAVQRVPAASRSTEVHRGRRRRPPTAHTASVVFARRLLICNIPPLHYSDKAEANECGYRRSETTGDVRAADCERERECTTADAVQLLFTCKRPHISGEEGGYPRPEECGHRPEEGGHRP